MCKFIAYYILTIGFNNNIRKKYFEYNNNYNFINYSVASTVKYINDEYDTMTALSNFYLSTYDNIKLNFIINRKSDEMWIGVTNNLKAIENTNGYWKYKNCWTY